MPTPQRLRSALRAIVHELIEGNFSALEQDGRAGRVGAQGLQRAISEYGRHLIELPEEVFEISDPIAINGQLGAWHIDLDLWTAEEGRSDLTLSVTAIETVEGVLISIEDLHVL